MQRPLPLATSRGWLTDVIFLTLLLGGLFFTLLGDRPLFVPDEGRYAEIAREMVASGNYITPHLNEIKYFEKPILFYWLAAAAIKVGGLHLWSIRFVNAFLGLMGCLLTYFTARKLYGRSTGLLAAIILGTSTLYCIMARMISLDLTVTVFLAICLYTFLLGIQHPLGRTRRLYLWSSASAAALAVLTKGLIGLVFPSLIIGTWIMLMGEWRLVKNLYLPSCLFIFLLIAAPWHIAVGIYNPEFFHFYFIEQHFLRYTTKEIGHYQPVWFFIPCLILGFFPWIVFLPQALFMKAKQLWKRSQQHPMDVFLLLWALLIFTFFSFSKSKLIPYILPVFPPFAILTAAYLSQSLQSQFKWGVRLGYGVLLLLAISIGYVFYYFPSSTTLPNPAKATLYLNSAAFILIIGSFISCIIVYRHRLQAIVITIATNWLFLLVALASVSSIDNRSILPLTQPLKSILKPQDEVVTFNQYYQDLPFYLERRVSILNWRNELTFGMSHQPTQEWMINDKIFWQHWHSQKRLFVFISLDEYKNLLQNHPEEHFYLLGKTINNALISNKGQN